jgi:hypothetical protein
MSEDLKNTRTGSRTVMGYCTSILASLGQKDPPQKENGIFFQKLDRSFKKGSGSND